MAIILNLLAQAALPLLALVGAGVFYYYDGRKTDGGKDDDDLDEEDDDPRPPAAPPARPALATTPRTASDVLH